MTQFGNSLQIFSTFSSIFFRECQKKVAKNAKIKYNPDFDSKKRKKEVKPFVYKGFVTSLLCHKYVV
jgi:hypothetical protein